MTTTHTPGRIYLADQRRLTQTAQHQRLSHFNFGAYEAESAAPFGQLLACNEERLAAGQTIELPPPTTACYLVLLPITGAVEFAGPGGLGGSTDVAQVQVLTLPAGTPISLGNPSAAHTSLLLHLWLQADPRAEPTSQAFDYEITSLDNQLAPLVSGLPFALALGRFAGRREAVVQPAGKYLFACVLAGAFEVQGRLLHAGDGLALWDCPEAELEALSNEALVLVLEP